MYASRVMISLLSLCLTALLLSPASAEPPRLSPAAGGVDEWLDDLPAEMVTALQAAAPGGTIDDATAPAAADGIAVPPARRQGFRLPRHPSAFSPEARRGLEHEARCGPLVPVWRGFQWPEWKPRCRGGDDDADGSATGAGGVPSWTWLPSDVDEP